MCVALCACVYGSEESKVPMATPQKTLGLSKGGSHVLKQLYFICCRMNYVAFLLTSKSSLFECFPLLLPTLEILLH